MLDILMYRQRPLLEYPFGLDALVDTILNRLPHRVAHCGELSNLLEILFAPDRDLLLFRPRLTTKVVLNVTLLLRPPLRHVVVHQLLSRQPRLPYLNETTL